MKKLLYILGIVFLFSCANNLAKMDEGINQSDELFSMQEKAFFGYDMDKVYENEITIKVKANNDKDLDSFMKKISAFAVTEVGRLEGCQDGEMYLCVKATSNYPETLKTLRNMEDVFYAEPNYKVSFSDTKIEPSPSDEILHPFNLAEGNLDQDPVGDEKEYALAITEALKAYKEFKYGENKVWVGIVDTGTNGNHEDMQYKNGEKVVKVLKTAFAGYNKISDVSSGNSDTEPNEGGHGTHCSGTICAAGDNDKGIAGVAWKNVNLISYKGMQNGSGSNFSIYGSLKHLADTVRTRVSQEKQATVPVNLSLGGVLAGSLELEALNYCLSKGILPVAANGNDGQFLPSYPAAFPGVLTVGASSAEDKKIGFSTSGAWLNVVAPGHNIISLGHLSTSGYVHMSGTSMATPFVVGTIAYLLSFDPTIKPQQMVAILEKTADKIDVTNKDPAGKYDDRGFSKYYGYGRVNVYKAAKMIIENRIPEAGKVYVETKLTVKAGSIRPIFVYDKITGALVTMVLTRSGKAEIRGLRPGNYNVLYNRKAKEVTIGNDKDVIVAF